MDVFERLSYLVKMRTTEDIQEFETTVWDLAKSKDPMVLSKLIDLFDDRCPYYEVMYSLVHAIETYPDEIYVKGVIKKILGMFHKSGFWLQGLISSILNHPNCSALFRQNMNLAPKESLLKLFEIMEKESPHHRELIQELRQELKKS